MIPTRVTWMLLGVGVTTITRWKTERSIATATEQLEARLPASVSRAAGALPGDVLRVGGTAVVAVNAAVTAGKVAKGAAGATGTTVRAGRRAAGAATDARRAVRRGRDDLGAALEEVAAQWRTETGNEQRRLRSEMLRASRGEAAALEATLDVRRGVEALPETPAPIPAGRRRPVPVVAVVVERVQRTYRPPAKAWDEPGERRLRPGPEAETPGQRGLGSG